MPSNTLVAIGFAHAGEFESLDAAFGDPVLGPLRPDQDGFNALSSMQSLR